MSTPVLVLLGAVEELRERRRVAGRPISDELEALRNLLFRFRTVQDGSLFPQIGEVPHAGGMGRLLVDIEDAAEMLDVSAATVKRLIKAGELPAVKVAGATRIRTADLGAYTVRLVPMNVPQNMNMEIR